MDLGYGNDKSGKADHPPAYQADIGYNPGPGVTAPPAGLPPAHGYGGIPYGAGQVPYPGQAAVTVQPTVYVTPTPINPVPDYLAYSIFTMLCCCLPLGIAALIYSINTRDANMTGNRDLAMRNSRVSRLLNNIALGFGIVAYVLCIVLFVVSLTSVSYYH